MDPKALHTVKPSGPGAFVIGRVDVECTYCITAIDEFCFSIIRIHLCKFSVNNNYFTCSR
jgi:hypothetical protein